MKKFCFLTALLGLCLMLGGCGSRQAPAEKRLQIWTQMPDSISASGLEMAQTKLYQALEEATGVKVSFIHPRKGQEKAGLTLMLASGQLPDIIEYNWISFPGGPEKALADGYIIDLTEHIQRDATNLKAYLAQNPEVDQLVRTDGGKYYVFPFVRGGEQLLVSQGPVIRKDYLEQLGSSAPETIDDWTQVLRQMKQFPGVKYPLSLEAEVETSQERFGLHSAFQMHPFFYVEEGTVKFGVMQPGYRNYLMQMNAWYEEGLLDPDYAVNDRSGVDTKMVTGEAVATVTTANDGIGGYFRETGGKNFDLEAAPYPTGERGALPFIGQRDHVYTPGWSSAITPQCADVATAVRFLDYAYSGEGHDLMNFGIENVTYTKEGSHYRYSDQVLNNAGGKSIQEVLADYTRVTYGGSFVQDPQYLNQCLIWPQQKDAVKIWANTAAQAHILPLVTPTETESEELARIMNNVNVCIGDNVFDFISGKKPFTEFDSFLQQLRELGIERAVEINQSALQRYENR